MYVQLLSNKVADFAI